MHKMQDKNAPSQGSGSFLAARSSIENDTSTPLSRRVSGSALISQYCRPPSEAASTSPSPPSFFASFFAFVFDCAEDFFSTGGGFPRLANAGAGTGGSCAGTGGSSGGGEGAVDGDDSDGEDDGGGDGARFWPALVFFPRGCLAPLGVALVLALGVRVRVAETSWGGFEEAAAAEVAVRWRVDRRGGGGSGASAAGASGWVDFRLGMVSAK